MNRKPDRRIMSTLEARGTDRILGPASHVAITWHSRLDGAWPGRGDVPC